MGAPACPLLWTPGMHNQTRTGPKSKNDCVERMRIQHGLRESSAPRSHPFSKCAVGMAFRSNSDVRSVSERNSLWWARFGTGRFHRRVWCCLIRSRTQQRGQNIKTKKSSEKCLAKPHSWNYVSLWWSKKLVPRKWPARAAECRGWQRVAVITQQTGSNSSANVVNVAARTAFQIELKRRGSRIATGSMFRVNACHNA